MLMRLHAKDTSWTPDPRIEMPGDDNKEGVPAWHWDHEILAKKELNVNPGVLDTGSPTDDPLKKILMS